MSHHRVASRTRIAAGLAACALAMLAAAPAEAQYFGGFGGPAGAGEGYGLGPGQVRASLERRGFRVLAPLRRNDSVYVADVLDRMGRRERFIVDMADGAILQRFIVEDEDTDRLLPDVERRGVGVPGPYDDPRGGRLAPRDAGPDGYGGHRDEGVRLDGRPIHEGYGASREDGVRREASRSPALVPPLKSVRPPVGEQGREAGREREVRREEARPAAPAAPHPAAPRLQPAPPVTPPAARPAEVAGAAPSPRRMSNPLAIPGGSGQGPVRSVSPGITGAPPARAGHGGDAAVPAAPLD